MPDLDHLTPEQLRIFAADLLLQVRSRDQAIAERDDEIKRRKLREDKLTHELALLRRYPTAKAAKR